MDETKKIFSRNLTRLIAQSGKSQKEIAEEMGFKYTTVNTWCKGGSFPSTGKLQVIADYFHLGKEDLIAPYRPKENVIPVLGRVAAGIPIEAIEDIVGEEEVSKKLGDIRDLFGLKIKGDSMSPVILNGDIVIVRKQEEAESGDIVIATLNGDDAICKKLVIYASTIILRSLNPAYDDIDVTSREDFRIWGKVIEMRRSF